MGSGTVSALRVNVGDSVSIGQELMQLDLDALNTQLEIAIAAQSSALAARRKASIEVSEASRQVELSRRLLRDQVRSRESVNQAIFDLRRARANLSEFDGALQQRRAQISELRHKLSQANVKATISGVVSSIDVQPGELIITGQHLIRVINPDELAVRFAIPKAELHKITKGAQVEMTAKGESIPLHVVSVSPNIDPGLQLAFALALPDTKRSLNNFTPGTVATVKMLP